jgi:signal peptidase I
LYPERRGRRTVFFNPAILVRSSALHVPALALRRGLAAALIAAALSLFIPVRPAITIGRSMEPALRNGQPFVFSSLRGPQHAFRRGDVVVLRVDGLPSVKRVAAVGGQALWVVPCSDTDPRPMWAIAPGEDLSAWKERFPEMAMRRYEVPPGTLFVVGDSPISRDSREYGPVDEHDVMGVVTWPALPEDPETWTFFHKLVPDPRQPRKHAGSQGVRIARR